jgi:signal transduction histidine kinase
VSAMGLPRLSAYVLAALVVLEVVAAGVLVVVADQPVSRVAIASVLSLFSVVLGVHVARRRPTNWVGPLLVLIALVAINLAFDDLYADVVQARPGLLPVWDFYIGLSPGTWMWLFVPPALLILVFPDGRLPGRRWRWVAYGLVIVPLLFIFPAAADPTPFEPPFDGVPHLVRLPEPWERVLGIFGVALLPVFLGLLVASAASMVVRYRRASGIVRTQVKWFMLGAMCLPATLLLGWFGYLVLGTPDLVLAGFALTYLVLPLATTIAVLRYDLYDVDKAISTAAAYGVITAALLAVFTLTSFVVGLAAGRASPIAAAAATAICAAVLAPLRTRIQRRVDRRLYPQRRAALAAIDGLRIRTYSGEAQPEQLEEVLQAALRDPQLRVGYLVPGRSGLIQADASPLHVDGDRRVPVRVGGHEIGALVGGTVASPELLGELADASTLLVEIVRLRIELRQALGEVESSRARLLHAGYEERRRLERDLHDGAQQRLVSLGMALRLAQRHLDDSSVDVDELLDSSVAELGTAVAELRQIAHGLRPSSLDDGLGPALSSLASKVPIPMTVEVAGEVSVDGLPDDVTTTAFFVASEAMANAVKHAQPGRIGLRVSRMNGQLTVQVRDDGRGGASVRPGAGLAGIADRVAAVGGALSISSPAGHGTVVEAVLPCGS